MYPVPLTAQTDRITAKLTDESIGKLADNNAGLAIARGALFFLNGPKLYRMQP